jgi:O-antigen/teichoic acid export membrane protein
VDDDERANLSGSATRAQDIESVGRSAVGGVVWLTAQKWAIRLFGLVTIAVLTRLLSPEDFGIVAASSTVLPFFYLLADLGFAAYIVQADKISERTLSTAFWFSALAGLVLFAGLAAAAPLLGLAFGSPDVVPILRVLSTSVLLTSLAAVPMALLRRAMRFRTLAAQGTTSAVIGQIAAIGFAVAGLGVWALVAQTLAAQLIAGIFAWAAARWRPSFTFSRADFGVLARFGVQVMGVEVVALIRAWAEAAIISATLGLGALGYMNIAQRLVQIVQDLTGAALVPVTSVAFAKVRDSVDHLRNFYLRALRLTFATISLPLMVLAVTAPLLIPIVFGDGWSASHRPAQILAIAGTLTVGASLDHGLLYGVGRPGRWFAYALAIDALTVAVTAFTARWGIEAVAVGFVVVCVIATIARWLVVSPVLGGRVGDLIRPFLVLLALLAADVAVGVAAIRLTSQLPAIASLGIASVCILAVHIVVLRLLARPALAEVSGYLSRLRRSRTVPPPIEPKESE